MQDGSEVHHQVPEGTESAEAPERAAVTYRLGLIVEQGAHLELIASQFAWSLLRQGPRRGEAVTKHMSLSQLLRLIGDLGILVLPLDLHQRLADAIRACRTAAQRRNEFVHSMWIEDADEAGRPFHGRLKVSRDPMKDAEYVLDPTSIGEIDDALETLETASAELASLWLEGGRRIGYIRNS